MVPAGDTRLTFPSVATPGSEDADFILTVPFDEETSGFLSFPFALFPSTKVGEVRVPRGALGVWREELRPGQGRRAVSVPAPLGVLSELGESGVSAGCPASRLHPPTGRLAPEPVHLGASGCVRCSGERSAFRAGRFWRKQGGRAFSNDSLKRGAWHCEEKEVFQVGAMAALARKVEKGVTPACPWWSSG